VAFEKSMSNVFQQPVCIITGGSSGIGLATARKLYDAGYRISICGRSQERLDKAAKIISADNALIDSKRLLTKPKHLLRSRLSILDASMCWSTTLAWLR